MLTFSTIIFVSNVQWNFLIDMIPKNLIPSMNHIFLKNENHESIAYEIEIHWWIQNMKNSFIHNISIYEWISSFFYELVTKDDFQEKYYVIRYILSKIELWIKKVIITNRGVCVCVWRGNSKTWFIKFISNIDKFTRRKKIIWMLLIENIIEWEGRHTHR